MTSLESHEVAFLEDYVLALDRHSVVEEVYDDDTIDYWYWNLLCAQVKGDKKELKQWLSKTQKTDFLEEEKIQDLFFRQALIEYGKKNWENVSERLTEICDDISFDHQQDRAVVDVKVSQYPTQLQLSTLNLMKEAFSQVDGMDASIRDVFTSRAAPFLANMDMDEANRVDFLELAETEYPDVTRLLDHVQADLESGTIFGVRKIHEKLTKKHLTKLAQAMPGNKNNPGIFGDESFLIMFCRKLRPITDNNLRENPELMKLYLKDLKDFAVNQIKDNHASLKALILYNYLIFQEATGFGYNKGILQKYMRIPKYQNIYKPEASVMSDNPQVSSDPYWVVEELPELDPIENDEPIIRRAMSHFFLNGDKTDAWLNYSDKFNYSLPLWAESQLLEGRGNQTFQDAQMRQYEKSYSPPGASKRLLNRVDLNFAPTNKNYYNVADKVELEFYTKNNPIIEVSVYDVEARNYYKEKLNEIPVDLNLNGSMTIDNFAVNFEHPPIRRVAHKVPLKCLAGRRGVFIIDLVGNGIRARALVRKGELRFISDQEKENATGYVFKVFNEKNEMIAKPRIWLEGNYYEANDSGDVKIPFATDQTNENELIILEDSEVPGSATLQRFVREKPEYTLECGMYVDREQLLRKKQARIIVRANLYMNNEIIPISNLKNVQFKLTLEDNSRSTKTRIEEFELFDDTESVFTFTVPTELRVVESVLTCTNPIGEAMISKQVVTVNSTDDTMYHANMFMFPSGKAGYVLAVRGKNGEGYPNVPIELSFNHRYFCESITEMVQTDENGHVYLGRLPDVDEVKATCNEPFVASEATFETLTNLVNVPTVIHRAAGTPVKIPFTPEVDDKLGGQAPIIHLYDKDYIQNFSNLAKYSDGFISCHGLPAGDYVLYIRDYQSLTIEICISEGLEVTNERGEYVISRSRVLELSEDEPLQIVSADGDRKEGYKIKLAGYNDQTRVHIVCCSQNPVFNVYGFLASPFCAPNAIDFTSPESKYLQAKNLDSEYQYIMERKHATKHVGNMLLRPSLLSRGGGYTSQAEPVRTHQPVSYKAAALNEEYLAGIHKGRQVDVGASEKRREGDPAALEFLGQASWVYPNRKVEEDGCITFEGRFIDPNHNVMQILAVDDDNTCLKNVILAEAGQNANISTTDVRLVECLEIEKHFTEVRRIICLSKASDEYTIADFSTAEYEPYETLEEPFNLYRTLAASISEETKDEFMKFEPLVRWHEMDLAAKLAFYDQQSCNEINFFIKRRDQEFFDTVVVPALTNKIQKTFFDKYLLGMPLLEFTSTSKFVKLNALEKILLAERMKEPDWTAKTLRTFVEMSGRDAVDPREQDEVFNMAINSRQLGVSELEKGQNLMEAQIVEAQLAAARGEVEEEEVYGKTQHCAKYYSQTIETQDTGYYRLPVTDQKASLIPHSRYWSDFAHFLLQPSEDVVGFLSEWFMSVNSNMNELLCALAVLDVPLDADEPKRIYQDDSSVKVLAKEPVILFVRELIETEVRTSAISVSTNYFDPMERMHIVDGENVDKFIYTNFKTNKVYGSRVVVTNVSSVEQRVEILAQIPAGSIPCGDFCFQTKSWSQVVEAFGTYCREYYFYWPEPGTFGHFPVHVNKHGATIGLAREEATVEVQTGLVEPDTSSWRYIANLAEEEVVLEFLAGSSQTLSVDLSKICWRFHDNPGFFDAACEILRNRCIYNERVWAYSILLDGGRGNKELGEFLSQNEAFRAYMGTSIKSKAVTIDLSASRDYQIVEFWPLMNPRAHTIDFTSTEYAEYYGLFLHKCACESSSLKDLCLEDKLTLTNYLLLRNLVEKAKTVFQTISKDEGKSCQMIYDYLSTYLSFHTGDAQKLQATALNYTNAPLPQSQKARWLDVCEQLEHRANPSLSDAMFLKKQEQARLAALEPFLDFAPEGDHTILIEHRNVPYITINFYRTELELMFSMYPFEDENVAYKLMLPNMSETLDLMVDGEIHSGSTVIELPEILQDENTIVEMITKTDKGEIKVTKVAYDNEIKVHVSREIGELRVLHSKNNEPIEKAYCKVYAQNIRDNSIAFYKDGYTDVRGRFDYRFLSSDQLRSSKRLSVLVSTESYGSVIKEVSVPMSMLTTTNLFCEKFSLRSTRN